MINDSNRSANINVSAGQIINVEFYHEAGRNGWPQEGLESTVLVDLYILLPSSLPLPDLDDDSDVDFADFAILASQWMEAPGIPSADIVPHSGDGIVDIRDLGLLAEYWLWQE